mmetsp:Transcript_39312/g.45115  ORF Transcript_39312/g.45115 Transcript_39312/m.45115 type:complete len:135 (-) Transcript_39312:138-542(-)
MMILSEFSMVVSLCAITIEVLPSITFSSASCTLPCDTSSSALVASSSSRILGLRMTALAMATRCFWPPDNLLPPTPQLESKPLRICSSVTASSSSRSSMILPSSCSWLSLAMKPSEFDTRAAATASETLTSSSP